jgi:hypothetical protein
MTRFGFSVMFQKSLQTEKSARFHLETPTSVRATNADILRSILITDPMPIGKYRKYFSL